MLILRSVWDGFIFVFIVCDIIQIPILYIPYFVWACIWGLNCNFNNSIYAHKYSFASSSIIFVYSKNIYVFDLVIIFEKNSVFNNILHKQNTTPTTNTENIWEEVDEEGKNIEREWKIHFSKKKLYSNSFCINTFSIKSPFIRLHGIKMSRI